VHKVREAGNMQQPLSSSGHIYGKQLTAHRVFLNGTKTSKPCLGWKAAAAFLSDLVHLFLKRKSRPGFFHRSVALTASLAFDVTVDVKNRVSSGIQATSSTGLSRMRSVILCNPSGYALGITQYYFVKEP